MKAKLTYLLLCVVAFCAAPSCSSDAEEPEAGTEIRFSPPVAGRARQTTTDNMASRGSFMLYSDLIYRADPDDPNEDPTLEHPIKTQFVNTEVRYVDGSWQYDGQEYWFHKHEHSFVAVHPYGTTTAHTYAGSKLSFTFELPRDPATTPDLLVATHRRHYRQGAGTPVVFRFGHVLSLVNLTATMTDNVLSDEHYVELQTVEISGFNTSASFAIEPSALQSNTQTDDNVMSMTGHAGAGSAFFNFQPAIKVANNGPETDVLRNDGALIMLPQAFATDSDAKIVVTYKFSDDTAVKQATLPLSNRKWDSGKSYTYKFTVDRTGAHFDATTIADWDAHDVGNINAH